MNTPDLVIQEKKFRILLLESAPFVYQDSTGNITGFEYDLIQSFIKQHKIDAEITFLTQDKIKKTYNEYVQDLADGKYDMMSGNITQTFERSQKITYSHPTHFDILSIFYEPKSTGPQINDSYYVKILLIVLKFIAIILVLGFFLAFIHYYSSNFKTTFTASLWRVYAALLGEPGLGVHPTKFNEKVTRGSFVNLTFRALLILLSALFGIYLGAIVTSERLANVLTNAPFSELKDLNGKTILAYADGSDYDILNSYNKMYNFKIEPFAEDGGTPYHGENISDYFQKNKEKLKLDGFIMASEAFRHYDTAGRYKRGTLLFPKSTIGIAFNNKNKIKIKQFNQIIHKLRGEGILIKLCKKYFKDVKDVCLQ